MLASFAAAVFYNSCSAFGSHSRLKTMAFMTLSLIPFTKHILYLKRP
jgi:ATP adenylyltransferase/5',5'''-P-1,P-4-tetraphosphate phosphorylase II